MTLDLSADEVLTTTRSVRKRLDLSAPVDRGVVEECLEIALQAPTGSNRQGWHWVFVEDPEKKRVIADAYRRTWDVYSTIEGPSYRETDVRAASADRVKGSAAYLAEHLHEVPLMLIPCHWGRVDGADTTTQAGFWGSILPAAWSFMLALRSRGLGSAWTTLHLPHEHEVADLLGIPYDKVTQAGLFPIAHTLGTDFKPAPRVPLESITHWDAW